ncbi:MAG: hypothetical protein ABL940_09300 [Bacteroidia bacterium]
MNLQLRKMNLIEFLLGVQDETFFTKIETAIHKSSKTIKPYDIVFTKADIIERAKFAETQIKKGLTLTQQEVEAQSKDW